MPRSPDKQSGPAPGSSAPHSSNHGSSRTSAALQPSAEPSPCAARLPHLLLAAATTAALLAGSRVPALTASTTRFVVGLGVPAQPPPRVADSRLHGPLEWPPSPQTPPEPPAHIHGSSPT